jgi:hypothetical protein
MPPFSGMAEVETKRPWRAAVLVGCGSMPYLGVHDGRTPSIEQIAFALHQADAGVSIEDVCRKMGISQATFF